MVWVLLGCGPERVDEIRIGFLPTTHGQFREAGEAMVRAAELAIQQANDQGGVVIDGRPHRVTLVTESLSAVPEESARGVQTLVNHGNVAAIVGPSLSEIAVTAAAYANQSGVPMVSPGASHPDVTTDKPFVFRVVSVDPVQGRAMGKFAREDLGAVRAAVLFDVTQGYNRDIAAVFREAFEARGGTVVAFEAYTAGQEDFGAQLTTILLARPDVLYLPNYPDDVRRQVRQARIVGLEAILLGSGAWSLLVLDGGERFDGSYFSSNWNLDVDRSESRAFVEAYRDMFVQDPATLAALAYDAFGLILHALSETGSVDGDRLRVALQTLRGYPGVTGSISYEGSGDPIKPTMIISVQGGRPLFHKWIVQ
jgi:branched-chain amino acid transport system substrate-binding protein